MGIKNLIQNKLHENNLKKYMAELQRQENAFEAYINVQEKSELKSLITIHEAKSLFANTKIVKFNEIFKDAGFLDGSYQFILFLNHDGLISEKTEKIIEEVFESNIDTNLIYFDEDEYDKDSNKRENPWFKPDFSPDSLLNSFYMGNAIVVRKEAVKNTNFLNSDNPYENLYELVLNICLKNEAYHLPFIMFHSFKNQEESFKGTESLYDKVKKRAYESLGRSCSFYIDKYGISQCIIDSLNNSVGIIIPSKNHPDYLKRSVKSIRDNSSYNNYEIIVVDNGSELSNKEEYENLSNIYKFKYIYEEMEFNFSKMCNMGAQNTKADYLLFLNDDTEIMTKDWLEKMVGQASLPHAGAVGAKLLYPDNATIQHVGITNMTEGPDHKLQTYSDEQSYYHGVNRLTRNVIGVTAACLMISREKFEKAEGFFEGLRVAYNDVDLCFRLYMSGLYNVIRNDVCLIHYESISRGNDHEDKLKMNRLKSERVLLYARTPQLYSIDPFYSNYLTGAAKDYKCVLPFENRNIKPVSFLDRSSLDKSQLNESLIINLDKAETEILWRDKQCLLIDLHCHVRGLDSSDYNYRLLLEDENGNIYEPAVIRRIRPDVIKTYSDQIHVELSGFVTRIPVELLHEGKYEIWMEAKSVLSRQILCNKAKESFIISLYSKEN